uniref:Uncharacterized protein n=1 Tax=Grammatophora oceanica TaxID=210454 RepID=A0A7S1VH89_9STRA|mmetsp:Transcript_46444/g.69131  ORF Transcript_46444/g.69131 Transcript_46444/m.69131 type:complete len:100 (+) Transcript_46444:99-398(+)
MSTTLTISLQQAEATMVSYRNRCGTPYVASGFHPCRDRHTRSLRSSSEKKTVAELSLGLLLLQIRITNNEVCAKTWLSSNDTESYRSGLRPTEHHTILA